MAKRPMLLATAVAMIVACSGTASPVTTGTTSTTSTGATPTTATAATVPDEYPMTVDSGGVTTTLDHRPESIVSLSPTGTEMVFSVGAGDQVVAVDEYSDYPPEAPVTDLSGYIPNLEAIVSYEPDLVIVSDDADGIVAALEDIGVPVLMLPAAEVVPDALAEVRLVGRVTGHADEGDAVASEMEADIAALLDGVEPSNPPLTYYHELGSDGGGSYYSATSATFIGEVFGAFGLVNIADEADADGSGYPLLPGEFILGADPDIIFFTSCCGDTPESISARPGWSDITAVRHGAVVELNDDLSSRWGPRLVQFFEVVASAVEANSN